MVVAIDMASQIISNHCEPPTKGLPSNQGLPQLENMLRVLLVHPNLEQRLGGRLELEIVEQEATHGIKLDQHGIFAQKNKFPCHAGVLTMYVLICLFETSTYRIHPKFVEGEPPRNKKLE